jgi:hypothetical protein
MAKADGKAERVRLSPAERAMWDQYQRKSVASNSGFLSVYSIDSVRYSTNKSCELIGKAFKAGPARCRNAPAERIALLSHFSKVE